MSLVKDEKSDVTMTNDMEQEDKINIEEVFIGLAPVKEEPLETSELEEMGEVDPFKIELKNEDIFEAKSDNRDGYNLIGLSDGDTVDIGIVKVEDIKTDYPSLITTIKHFGCNNCGGDYERYCLKCSTLSRILNNIVPDLNTTPTNILEITDVSRGNRVFALKTLPQNVIFGPFEGLSAIESTNGNRWKIKDSKFANKENANWMKYVVCTANRYSSNLDIFQFDGNLYFETNREIQEGEELLICFGEEVKSDNEEECYFVPVKKEEFSKIFACTLCCLGFRLERCLVEHKSKCPHEEDKGNIEDFEIVECHSCKMWLEKQEHLESHMQYCLEHYNRALNTSWNWQGIITNVDEVRGNCDTSTLNNEDVSSPDTTFKTRANIKPHQCAVCDMEFSRQNNLKEHIEDSHSGMMKRDLKCSEDINTHSDVNHYGCKICTKSFRRQSNLKAHVNAKHLDKKEKDTKCPECYYQTNYKSDLSKHLNTHSDIKPHEYDICIKSFREKSKLKKHVNAIHSNKTEKNYKCPGCSYQTNHKSDLRKHLNTHKGIKPFECDICKIAFRQKCHLKEHVNNKHSEKVEKDHKCPICSYQTNYKSDLGKHLNTHKDIKPFECDICKIKFRQKSYVKEHINNKHSEKVEKDHKCPKCSYKTNYKSDLVKHLKTHKDIKPFECDICQTAFRQKYHLKEHINNKHSEKVEKDHKCPKCSYQTNYKSDLGKHLNTHKDIKPYQCEICEKAFRQKSSLKEHLNNKHSDKKEQKFKCPECSFRTNYGSYLNKHLNTHNHC